MPKFENRFVHFTWDESLKDRKCFVADSISKLKSAIEDDCSETIIGCLDEEFPFETETNYYCFAYYDPNFDVKKSYEQGEMIQYKAKDTGRWCDWDDSLGKCTFVDSVEYRIKPKNTYCVVVDVSSRLVAIKKSFAVEGAHVFYKSDSLEDCADWITDRRKFEDVMVAYSEGKEVEFLNVGNIWCRALTPEWKIGTKYRIKPKKYRAFKDTDELKKKWEELCPTNIHGPSLCEPLIWVKSKLKDSTGVISRFEDTVVGVSYTTLDLEELFETFTFLDGTPCGTEE